MAKTVRRAQRTPARSVKGKSAKTAPARRSRTAATSTSKKTSARKATSKSKKTSTRKSANKSKSAKTTRGGAKRSKAGKAASQPARTRKTPVKPKTTSSKTKAKVARKSAAKPAGKATAASGKASGRRGAARAAGTSAPSATGSPDGKAARRRTKSPYTRRALGPMRTALLEMRARLLGDMSLMGQEALRADDSDVDAENVADHGTDAFDRHMTLELMENEARTLRQINEALETMTQGRYGICSECSEAIPLARLEVLPFAQTCVRCQEAQERLG